MDSLNLPRQGLLLELVRDITQNNTAGYSDQQIYENVKEYQKLFKSFKESQALKEIFPYDDEVKLNKLHLYFYGEEFNFSDPSDTALGKGDNIYVEFKKVFEKIEELAKTKEVLSDQLLQTLKEILGTVVYSNSKNNDKILAYLNLIDGDISSYKSADIKDVKIKKTYKSVDKSIKEEIDKKVKEKEENIKIGL